MKMKLITINMKDCTWSSSWPHAYFSYELHAWIIASFTFSLLWMSIGSSGTTSFSPPLPCGKSSSWVYNLVLADAYRHIQHLKNGPRDCYRVLWDTCVHLKAWKSNQIRVQTAIEDNIVQSQRKVQNEELIVLQSSIQNSKTCSQWP